MEIELEKLQSAFGLIDNVPADDSDSSKMVKVSLRKEGLRLALAGLVSGSVTCAGKGPSTDVHVHVDRRYLRAFLDTARGPKVIIQGEEQLQLTCGYQKSRLTPVKVDGAYPRWKGEGKLIKLPVWLQADLPCLIGFCQRLPGAEYFELIQCIAKYGVMATDSLSLMACLDTRLPLTAALPKLFAEVVHKTPSASLFYDQNALVLKTAQGYLQQPICAAANKYPLKELQGLLTRASKAASPLRLKAEHLADELRQIGRLSTSGSQAVVILKTTEKGRASLVSITEQATVERALKLEQSGAYEATWVTGPVLEFAAHLASVDPDCEIAGGRLEHSSFFRATVDKRTYLLLMIDRA